MTYYCKCGATFDRERDHMVHIAIGNPHWPRTNSCDPHKVITKEEWTLIIGTMVHGALENAFENGDLKPGGMLHGATPLVIATDLVEFDAELEGLEPHSVEPFVKDWMEKNNGG